MGSACPKFGFGSDSDSEEYEPLRRAPRHLVKLVISEIGIKVPGVGTGFHTSVMMDDCEFAFSIDGICPGRGIPSHQQAPEPPAFFDYGYTDKTPAEMLRTLAPHFLPGTYDLLRKNCNSFSDCCLYYLVGERMDPSNRKLEKRAVKIDKWTGVVAKVTGEWKNPQADLFKSQVVISNLDAQKKFEDQAYGGRPPKRARTRGVALEDGDENADIFQSIKENRQLTKDTIITLASEQTPQRYLAPPVIKDDEFEESEEDDEEESRGKCTSCAVM
jgi:hypothetical protein